MMPTRSAPISVQQNSQFFLLWKPSHNRKAWLFSDTPQGAHASATCYSLIETAKANQLEPYGYIKYLLDHIGTADTLEKLEALLPWNVPLEKFAKKVNAFDGKQ